MFELNKFIDENNIKRIIFKNKPFEHIKKSEMYNVFLIGSNNKIKKVITIDLNDLIKVLDIKMSENIFLSEYFLKSLIKTNKILYL